MLLIFLISYQAHSPSDAQCHRCLGPFSLLTKLNCVSFDLMPFTKMPFIPLHSYARDTVANKSISMNEFLGYRHQKHLYECKRRNPQKAFT